MKTPTRGWTIKRCVNCHKSTLIPRTHKSDEAVVYCSVECRHAHSGRKRAKDRVVPVGRLTLADLAPSQCPFPVTADKPFLFCGAQRDGDRIYCRPHCDLAFRKREDPWEGRGVDAPDESRDGPLST